MIKFLQMEILLFMYIIVAKKMKIEVGRRWMQKLKIFLSYKYKTGKVVRGDKRDWSQAGSQDYVDIIGRY